ncbi:MAG: ROK family protein [Betaproteobacteria bacterium]
MYRFGIDLGGTKIEILALDAAGQERHRARVATPHDDYAATLAAITGLVRDSEKILSGMGTVGIATPGAISHATGTIKNANSTCLNGKPLVQDLQRKLLREIRIANDANCFALSEATDGAASGAAVVFGVILGTGVGGGVVVNGRLLTGANAIAGEWGHNPLPVVSASANELPGNACYCGRRGCIETWLSGPALAQHFLQDTGREFSAEQIVANAPQDAHCESALLAYEDRLARSLGVMVNILDPDVIVLGGGLSGVPRWYDAIPRRWAQYVFSDRIATRLLPPKFGATSGARGAAWLWNA